MAAYGELTATSVSLLTHSKEGYWRLLRTFKDYSIDSVTLISQSSLILLSHSKSMHAYFQNLNLNNYFPIGLWVIYAANKYLCGTYSSVCWGCSN